MNSPENKEKNIRLFYDGGSAIEKSKVFYDEKEVKKFFEGK